MFLSMAIAVFAAIGLQTGNPYLDLVQRLPDYEYLYISCVSLDADADKTTADLRDEWRKQELMYLQRDVGIADASQVARYVEACLYDPNEKQGEVPDKDSYLYLIEFKDGYAAASGALPEIANIQRRKIESEFGSEIFWVRLEDGICMLASNRQLLELTIEKYRAFDSFEYAVAFADVKGFITPEFAHLRVSFMKATEERTRTLLQAMNVNSRETDRFVSSHYQRTPIFQITRTRFTKSPSKEYMYVFENERAMREARGRYDHLRLMSAFNNPGKEWHEYVDSMNRNTSVHVDDNLIVLTVRYTEELVSKIQAHTAWSRKQMEKISKQ